MPEWRLTPSLSLASCPPNVLSMLTSTKRCRQDDREAGLHACWSTTQDLKKQVWLCICRWGDCRRRIAGPPSLWGHPALLRAPTVPGIACLICCAGPETCFGEGVAMSWL